MYYIYISILCAAFSPLLLNEDARAAYLSFANTNSAHVTGEIGST